MSLSVEARLYALEARIEKLGHPVEIPMTVVPSDRLEREKLRADAAELAGRNAVRAWDQWVEYCEHNSFDIARGVLPLVSAMEELRRVSDLEKGSK